MVGESVVGIFSEPVSQFTCLELESQILIFRIWNFILIEYFIWKFCKGELTRARVTKKKSFESGVGRFRNRRTSPSLYGCLFLDQEWNEDDSDSDDADRYYCKVCTSWQPPNCSRKNMVGSVSYFPVNIAKGSQYEKKYHIKSEQT